MSIWFKFKQKLLLRFIIMAAIVLLALPTSQLAQAATITVTTTADGFTDDAHCTLREAIYAANANTNTHENACTAGSEVDTDTITLTSGATYPLTITGANEEESQTGDLDIKNNINATIDLIIQSNDDDFAIITQGATDRVLEVHDGSRVMIFGVHFMNGSGVDQGGGIYNHSTLELTGVAVSSNSALGTPSGGGIYNLGSLSMFDVEVYDNQADGGAGIVNDGGGPLTVNLSEIYDNTAENEGGGIWNLDGTATISDTEIWGNSSAAGGGIDNADILIIQDSTIIRDNTAGTRGGGISTWLNTNVTISDSIIANNEVTNGRGGGLWINSDSTVNISNTQFTHNTASDASGALYSGLSSATLSITGSCIVGNSEPAIENTFIVTQTATGNWWGTESGPAPIGTGDAAPFIWNTSGFLTTPPVDCLPKYDSPTDYDASADSEVVIFRSGAWHLYNYNNSSVHASVWTGTGGTNPRPVMMDYDGDGQDEFTLFVDEGAWHFFNADGSYYQGMWIGQVSGDLPVPADYDGDGMDDVVTFNAGAWNWYDLDLGGYVAAKSVWTGTGSAGTAYPAPMDYDKDGKAEFTIYTTAGAWHFFDYDGSYVKGIWVGFTNGIPVPADYDGDGVEDVVLFQNGAWHWFDYSTGDYDSSKSIFTGQPTHKFSPTYTSTPEPLDVDADGQMDRTIYAGGRWYFYDETGAEIKWIATGGVMGDQSISGRPALP